MTSPDYWRNEVEGLAVHIGPQAFKRSASPLGQSAVQGLIQDSKALYATMVTIDIALVLEHRVARIIRV